jgi:hypothetical protein
MLAEGEGRASAAGITNVDWRQADPATAALDEYEGSTSARDCKLKETTRGVIVNTETGQPFTYKDACVRTDPHVGYHEAAATATRTAVKAFLRTTFKLNELYGRSWPRLCENSRACRARRKP